MGTQSPLSSLGQTAIEVAAVRARESERPDRLFDDPYAALFVAELGDTAAQDGTPQAARESLALQVAVRTRFFDDYLLDACGIGCRQVVLLASGLDARAFRLDWPAGVRVFELDLPDIVEFKDATLAAHGATPRCRRVSLAADLRGDWPRALLDAGFDRSAPTAWLAEGLLIYLTAEEATRLLDDVAELSAPGSQLASERANFADPVLLEQANALLGMNHLSALWKGGLGHDAADWLRARGWEVYAHDMAQIAAACGRPSESDVGGGFLTSIYRGID